MTFNSGAEDVLLFSNDHSFFQHTGYTRTSNFAQTYLDTPCKGGTCQLGTTATFELTKEGDLLGATDLMIRVMPPENLEFNGANGEKWGVAWVENLGYAMLERITLTIGNGGEVEVLSGEILNIQNEMFKDSGNRLHNHILKTSVTPFPTTLEVPEGATTAGTDVAVKNHIPGIRNNGGVGLDEQKRHSRLIGTCMKDGSGNKSCKIYQTEPLNLVIPLETTGQPARTQAGTPATSATGKRRYTYRGPPKGSEAARKQMSYVRSHQSLKQTPQQPVQQQANQQYAYASNFQRRYSAPTQSRWGSPPGQFAPKSYY